MRIVTVKTGSELRCEGDDSKGRVIKCGGKVMRVEDSRSNVVWR